MFFYPKSQGSVHQLCKPFLPCFSDFPGRLDSAAGSLESGNEAPGSVPAPGLWNLLVLYLNHEKWTCLAQNNFSPTLKGNGSSRETHAAWFVLRLHLAPAGRAGGSEVTGTISGTFLAWARLLLPAETHPPGNSSALLLGTCQQTLAFAGALGWPPPLLPAFTVPD